MTSSVSRIRDALVELNATDLTLDDRRALVAEVKEFLSIREGNHVLQELLTRVDDGLQSAGAVSEVLKEWRPMVERLAAAEAERVELENTQRKEGSRWATWAMGAVDAKTLVFVLAILGGLLGLNVTLPGGISLGQPEPAAVEPTTVEVPS